jgi:hypothetical protein
MPSKTACCCFCVGLPLPTQADAGAASDDDEEEEEGPDSEDERELGAFEAVASTLKQELKAKPPAPPRPTGRVWPADSKETGVKYCEVRSRGGGMFGGQGRGGWTGDGESTPDYT